MMETTETKDPAGLIDQARASLEQVGALATRHGSLGHGASRLKVFLPYLVWNTVFDNTRVVSELGRVPAPFSKYCYRLLEFSRENCFTYPYRDWPDSEEAIDAERPLVRGSSR